MKFANVNGQRQEAQRGLSGECPLCKSAMIAKCGKVRDKHWAHRGKCSGDVWWENETEWHRTWKNHFPESWQEIVHLAEDGTKHIADVKTDDGCVIEFQRSPITPEERRSRDDFYKQLVWVVDATRLKRDAAQFIEAVQMGVPIAGQPNIRRVLAGKCSLIQKWSGCPKLQLVYFDFRDGQALYWLLSGKVDEPMYIGQLSRADFIAVHHGKGPDIYRNSRALLWHLVQSVMPDCGRFLPPAIVKPTVRVVTTPPRYFIRRSRRL
jgi:hypothetical protein